MDAVRRLDLPVRSTASADFARGSITFIGTATVILRMTPVDGGTDVEIVEHPDGPYSLLALNPLLQVLTKVRNAESLRRLEELALTA